MILTPVLAIPDNYCGMKAYNDAFDEGLTCVSTQNEKLIEFSSRLLRSHERNYLTYDFELATVIHAFKIWRHY